jgi:hypothetical protein
MGNAPWLSDELVEGGLKGIESFKGRLVEVEEDVEGDFGMQLALHFEDVEVLESAEPIELEDGLFTTWIKQSKKRNSSNGKMLMSWETFAKAHNLMPLPKGFLGKMLEWKKEVYDYGEKVNPGSAYVPVKLLEKTVGRVKVIGNIAAPAAKSKSIPKQPPADEMDEGETPEIDEGLVAEIKAAIGTGATREVIKGALIRKMATRNKVSAAGGLKVVLDVLVAQGTLTEDEGVYGVIDGELPF